MSEQRYILTIQNNSIFKEVDVSADMPLLKIGTLQDYDVGLKRELFAMPICARLLLENNEWRIFLRQRSAHPLERHPGRGKGSDPSRRYF